MMLLLPALAVEVLEIVPLSHHPIFAILPEERIFGGSVVNCGRRKASSQRRRQGVH